MTESMKGCPQCSSTDTYRKLMKRGMGETVCCQGKEIGCRRDVMGSAVIRTYGVPEVRTSG